MVQYNIKIEKELMTILKFRSEWPLKSTNKIKNPSICIDSIGNTFTIVRLIYERGALITSDCIYIDDELNCFGDDYCDPLILLGMIDDLKNTLMTNILEYGLEYTGKDVNPK